MIFSKSGAELPTIKLPKIPAEYYSDQKEISFNNYFGVKRARSNTFMDSFYSISS